MSRTKQDALPADDMPEPSMPTKVIFVGVRADSNANVFQLGDQHEFVVRGRIVHLGPEEMADGHIRQLVKVKVEEVVPRSYDEPAPVQVISPDGDRDDIGNDD